MQLKQINKILPNNYESPDDDETDTNINIKEEIDENGRYQSFVEISKSMLQQFDNLEGANTLKPLST